MTWYEELGVKNPYYADDAVALIHADCRDVLPTLGRFDLLLTDPPYGIGIANNPFRQKFKRQSWDNDVPPKELLNSVIHLCDKSIIWGGNYFDLPPSQGFLIWDKVQPQDFSSAMVEFAWMSENRPAKLFRERVVNIDKFHPTTKPLALMAWCLQLVPDAVTVLDPFAGSGTTGRACKDLGRKCVLIEREEKYCEIAAKRMLQEVLF